jgi:hypothetical protein
MLSAPHSAVLVSEIRLGTGRTTVPNILPEGGLPALLASGIPPGMYSTRLNLIIS